MTSNNKNTEIEDLLIEYLNGSLSKEDSLRVENWIESSEENKKLLEQLYFVNCLGRNAGIMEHADADASYKVFQQKLKTRNKSRAIKKAIYHFRRVAAMLTIPLLITSIYFYVSSVKESTSALNQYVEARSSMGMVSKVDLPDGSIVWLNSNSRLKFPLKFEEGKRLVELEGEGFFEVEHDEESPFIVKVDDEYSVRVVGTSFNVVALKNENIIETTLLEGIVDLYVNDNKSVRLSPGDNSIFNKKDRTIDVSQVNAHNQMAWKDGILIFKSTSMIEVLRVLERNYNVKFDIQDPNLKRSTLTAKFERQQLHQILDFLSLASNIEFKTLGRKNESLQGATTISVTSKKTNHVKLS